MAVKFPDVLEANNTDEYGIVRANQVMGHKTVPTLNDLYQIKDFILSDSGNNTNNDAIGQRWYVVDQKKYYKLEDWNKRNQKEGWKQDVSESADVYIIKKEEWLLDETDLYKGNFTGYVDGTDIESFYTASEYSKAYNNARNLSLALQYAVDNGYKKIILETGKYALPSVYSVIVSGMKNVEIDLGGSTLYTIKEAYRTFSKVINDGNSKADIRSEIQNLINDQTAFTYGLYEGGTMFVVSNSSSSVIKNATFIGDRNYLDWRNKRASNLKVNVNLGDPGNTVGIQLFGDKLRVENITFREIRGEAVWTGINEDRRHINATLLDDGTYDYKGSISSKELTSAPNNSDGGHYIGNSQILNIGSVTESDLSKVDLVYPGMRNSYTVSNTFYKEITSSAARTGTEVIPVMLLDNSTISDLLDIEAYRNKLKRKGDATLTEKVNKGIFEIHSWGSVNNTYTYRRGPRASGENLLILTYQHENDGIENYTRAIRTSFGQQFQLNPWEKYVRIITLNDFYIDDSGTVVKTTSAKSLFSIIIALNRDQQIYNCDFINCFRGGIGIGSHGVVIDNCKFIKDDSINKVDSSENIYFTDDQSTVAYTAGSSNAMITTEGFQPCNLKVLNSYFNASNGCSFLIIQAHDVFISNCVFYNITFGLYWTINVDINNCKIHDEATRLTEMVTINIGNTDGYNKNSAEFYNLIRHINVNNNKIYCGKSIFRFTDYNNCFVNVYANEFLVTRQLNINFQPKTYNYWKNNSFHDNQVVMLTKYNISNYGEPTDIGVEDTNITIVFNADCYNNHFICNNGGMIQVVSPRFKDNTITGRVGLCPRQLGNSWTGNNIAEVIISDTQIEDVAFKMQFTTSDTLQSKTIIFDSCDISNLRLHTYNFRQNENKLPTIIFKNCYIKNSIKFSWFKTSYNNIAFPLHLKFFNCIYGNLTNNCLITIFNADNAKGTDQDTIEYDYSMPQLKLMDKYFSSTMNANTIIGAKSGTKFPSFPYEGMIFFKTDVNIYYAYNNNKWNQIGDNVIIEDSNVISQINSTLQNHEERLVYTEGDLVKVREEYNSIISELVKSIAHTQKAFVVETNDSEGYIYIDNVKKTIPANSIKAFRFNNVFKSGTDPNIGIASFRFLITDTSAVTTMNSMFSNCSSLTSIDLSNFDNSAVKDMRNMFSNCSSLTSINLSNFDTLAVNDMGYMFSNCSSLTSIDLSNFNTSAVTNMKNMFSNCSSLTSINLSNFDNSAVKDMGYMFEYCSSLTSIDLSNFNTSAVTNMSGMFLNCSSLTSIDLSNFDTSAVTYMRNMFSNCSSLTSINLSNFDTSAVNDMGYMFNGCSSLTSLLLGPNFFKTSAVTSIDFSYCSKWTNETVVTSLVTNSYDRASAGINTLTLKLHANTKAALTDEQKATITNKGYTIA